MSAKAGLAFSFNLLKINGLFVLLWGFARRMEHKIEYWVKDHKVA